MKENITTLIKTPLRDKASQQTNRFFNDVIKGLRSSPKHLDSKYFYDSTGDKLFQELMDCPEYYPTRCETEIFSRQAAELCKVMIGDGDDFDLIELGAGDAKKSTYLLKYLLDQHARFTYQPIDISENIISYLTLTLPVSLPGLEVKGLNGEYFDMLEKAATTSSRRKVVLFLGSNIGNMPIDIATGFCVELRRHLSSGDMALIGIDLRKHPKTILAAYNDAEGITKRFNLNLLERMNKELGANFDTNQFDHYPTYDPATGACKSYLISLKDQKVTIGNEIIEFCKNEYVFMEISQKYTLDEVRNLAAASGFKPVSYFFDEKRWFTDSIWLAQ